MKHQMLIVVILLIGSALACNAPTGGGEEAPTTAAGAATLTPEPTAQEDPDDTPTEAPQNEPATAVPTATIGPTVTLLPTPDGTAPTTAPESTEPAVEIGRPEVGEVIYQTNFVEGWPSLDLEDGSTEPVDGGYELALTTFALWTFTTQASRSTFFAEITAQPANCNAEASYGLLFHYENDETFRALVITCDGRFQLFQRAGERVAPVVASGSLPEEVDPSSGQHTIGVLAEAELLRFFVNDMAIGELAIGSAPEGDLGPYAQTGEDVPFSVVFSQLAVYELP